MQIALLAAGCRLTIQGNFTEGSVELHTQNLCAVFPGDDGIHQRDLWHAATIVEKKNALKGSITYQGDLISPIDVEWDSAAQKGA